jgi:hypothetical protein
MKPALHRFGAVAAFCGLLAACGDDRVTSTEVENEVMVLAASSEDTAPLVAARWVLTDGADTLASGTTDSSGGILAVFPRTDSTLLHLLVATSHGTMETVIDRADAPARDTIRTGVNLLTSSISRSWTRHGDFSPYGDSMARSLTGVPMQFSQYAWPRNSRPIEARLFLNVLAQRAQRSGTPIVFFVDSLTRTPGNGMIDDSAFARDLTDALREEAIPLDSQALVVKRIDSLGGRNGRLLQDFMLDRANADSLLLVSTVGWMSSTQADTFRELLLARARACGVAVLAQPRPAFSPYLVTETARRLTLRIYGHLLSEVAQVPDSAGMHAFGVFFDDVDSTVRETFLYLKIERWFGQDDRLDMFMAPIITASRSPSWRTSALMAASDPQSYVATGWPMPHGSTLRNAISRAASSGAWGPDLLVYPSQPQGGK